MRKLFKVLGIILIIIVLAVVGVASYVKLALPNVGDAPQLQVEKTPERIARGEYLANHVMICMDCHSTRNWNEFSAPPVPGTLGKGGDVFDKAAGFPGTYYAANITPAGIGQWTDGEIFRAITTGVRKNGKPIFPVMPHKNYGQLDMEDINAVIAYVRSLPAIENKVPESKSNFPMNFIINTIPQKAKLTKRPDPSDAIAYGKYMVTASACAECHTPFEKGSFVEDLRLAGGRTFQLPAGMLRSSNITPDKETGIGTWTKELFLNKFRSYRDSATAHQKLDFMKEYNTIMPWGMYAHMTDQDLSAIYDYLRTIKPTTNKVEKWVPSTTAATQTK
ncbi:MAG TPA: c-type cytochrome [Chitinophagaceae bacterium]|nr:c-type cytochrome [Chitinophagaceae bacterium]